LVLPLGTGRWGGGGEDDGLFHRAARVVVVEGGCRDPATIGPYGGSKAETEEENTEHRLSHQRKHGGRNRSARVRILP
jgi:hypothetical protein